MARYNYEDHPPLKEMSLAAVKCEASTKFPASVALGFWAGESDWGQKLTGTFNYWGATRSPEKGPASLCQTTEIITPAQLEGFRPDERTTAILINGADGQPLKFGANAEKRKYAMRRWFADYASQEESIAAFVSLFTDSPARYKAAWDNFLQNGDPEALCRGICRAGYATDPAAETIKVTIMNQENVRHAIEEARKVYRSGSPSGAQPTDAKETAPSVPVS